MSKKESFDPFGIFEIKHKPCYVLNVLVLRGRHISKGWLKDLMDTPDPFVKISLSSSPSMDQKIQPKETDPDVPVDPDLLDQRTPTVDNNKDPEWNYTLSFLVDLNRNNILTIELLDKNITEDESLGKDTFDLTNLPVAEKFSHTFMFEIKSSKIVAEVDVEFLLVEDQNPALRYSLCLPDEEKAFLKERRKHVMEGMQEHLGDNAPKSPNNAPVIAVMGSGGGFRALIGYCGAMKALYESGILDMVTYVAGLSGSAWYISHLYSNPDWPECSPGDLFDDLRDSVTKPWTRKCRPTHIMKYMSMINKKKKAGQPVSFTDFFGRLIGELIIGDRINAKLSYQTHLVNTGEVPMPLYTCVSVKSDVSAQEFHEWVEFTPYEIGMAKYGIFMKTENFGSRFFLGRLLKKYPEPPLHYLQGVWGSAFTILFKRLVNDDGGGKQGDHPREVINERLHLLESLQTDIDESAKEDIPIEEEESVEEEATEEASENGSPTEEAQTDSTKEPDENHLSIEKKLWGGLFRRSSKKREKSASEKSPSGSRRNSASRTRSRERSHSASSTRSNSPVHIEPAEGEAEGEVEEPVEDTEQIEQNSPTFSEKIMNMMCAKYAFIGSRKGRAAFIHNFLHGLELNKVYPLSPFDHLCSQESRANPFLHIFDAYDTEEKTLCMVDAGLSFNSPFPPLLRPQRGVDIFISFDFSAREKDDSSPLTELKLAEMWARVNNIPFPRIDETIFEREGLKEVYVFQNPEDPMCPVVLHFPLVNLSYKEFKQPGVPRETKEEKDHGNFKIFDDPHDAYSTFNFKYTMQSFNRLVSLMEYNVLNNEDVIKTAITECVEKKNAQRKTRNFMFKNALQKMAFQSTMFSGLLKKLDLGDAAENGSGNNGVEDSDATMKRKTLLHNAMMRNILSKFKSADLDGEEEAESEQQNNSN